MLFRIVGYAGRITSLFVTALVVAMFFDGGGRLIPTSREMIGLSLFPGAVIMGFGVSWKWPVHGAAISCFGLAGFYCWHWMSSGSMPSGPWFMVLTAPALLFLTSSLNARVRDTTPGHPIH